MSVTRNREGRRGSEFGASLVELLVVLVLVSVVGTIAVNGVVTAMRVSRQTEQRVHAAAELQRAAERLSRDVRAACPLEVLEADRLEAIVHPDGGAPSRAAYRFDTASETLVTSRTPGSGPVGPERVLLSEVVPAGPLFTYWSTDGTEATSAADVRTVTIVLRRDLAEQDPVEIETVISLRNGGRACD